MMRALPLIPLIGLLIFFPGGGDKPPSAASETFIQESQQDRPATDEQAALKPESISPYLIEWYIDINEDADLKHIWRALKMEIPEDMSYRCGGGCEAETFDIQMAGEEPRRTVAVKISFESGDFYQYLIFKKENPRPTAPEKWRFIGNIDSPLQRYGPPKHRIETGDNHVWFVVRELWGRGSGMMSYGEIWYEIKDRKVKEVLRCPLEGHNIPCQKYLGYSYKSLLTRHGSMNGVYTVPVQFLVSYNISDCEKGNDSPSLFTKAQKAYFVWNAEEERFVLDSDQSQVTEDELDSVYNIEGLSNEKFAEYNFSELSEIARSGTAEQRDWLKQFLTRVPDGPRKAALQESLGQ